MSNIIFVHYLPGLLFLSHLTIIKCLKASKQPDQNILAKRTPTRCSNY